MPEKVILCVDDEEIILEVLKEQLKRRLGNEYLIEVAQGEGAEAELKELSGCAARQCQFENREGATANPRF